PGLLGRRGGRAVHGLARPGRHAGEHGPGRMSRDRVTPMTTTTTRDHWNGWACTDCVMFLANGETPPDWDEARTAEWRSRIEKHMTGTAHVTLGRLIGEDGCDCTHYDTDDHREG